MIFLPAALSYVRSLCFVCSHLAAGQSHVAERNQDVAETMRRMSFGRGRTIAGHDNIFWWVARDYSDLSDALYNCICVYNFPREGCVLCMIKLYIFLLIE